MGQRLQKKTTCQFFFSECLLYMPAPKQQAPTFLPRLARPFDACLLSWWYCFVDAFIGIPVSLQRSGYQLKGIVNVHIVVRIFNGDRSACILPSALMRWLYRDFHWP